MNRNVYFLALSQAFAVSSMTMIIFIGGLVGNQLTNHTTWATLPIALMLGGAAASTLPAALLMKRIGRRTGFLISILVALIASLFACYTIFIKSFTLFCLATLIIGTNSAFTQQYRFAAAESVPIALIPRAISYMLIATLVAAYLGPQLGYYSRNWFSQNPYIGSFLVLAGLYIIAGIFILFYRNDNIKKPDLILKNSQSVCFSPFEFKFLVAVIVTAGAYGIMSLIMTATPISMHLFSHFSLPVTAHVLQGHLIAMYAPALITSYLIQRIGIHKLLIIGIICFCGCIAFAVTKQNLIHYSLGLILLGLGWNFLFIGGSTLLIQNYQPPLSYKVQGLNDFIMMSFAALGSISAGSLIYHIGWRVMNFWMLPIIVVMLSVIIVYRYSLTHEKI